jgi:hypothetical protein
MYRKKYNPEESLQRIKLMMSYDSSETLRENLQKKFKVLSEQTEKTDQNTLLDADLLGNTNKFRQYYQFFNDFGVFDMLGFNAINFLFDRRTGVKGAVDALDGFVDSNDLAHVLLLIKTLDGKCYYDDVDGKSISATERFLQLYQEDEGEDLKDDVNSVGTSTLKTGAEKIKRQIIKAIDTQVAKGCPTSKSTTTNERQNNINSMFCSVKNGVIVNPKSKMNNMKWEDYKTKYSVTDAEIAIARESCPKNDSDQQNRQQVPIPEDLKDTEGVKKFQDWLDDNVANWATGYTGGKLNKTGRGYGRFGPRTQRQWNNKDVQNKFLNKGQSAEKTPATTTEPEVPSELVTINPQNPQDTF